MRPRHPMPCLDARQTPAARARADLLLVSGAILAAALLLILALLLCTR